MVPFWTLLVLAMGLFSFPASPFAISVPMETQTKVRNLENLPAGGKKLQPYLMGHYPTSSFGSGIVVQNDKVYFLPEGVSLSIIDFSDRLNPIVLGAIPIGGFANDLVVVGNLAYISTAKEGLKIVNVADPHNPWILSTHPISIDNSLARAVAVYNNYAYLVLSGWGLQMIDVSNSSQPQTVLTLYHSGATDIQIVGNKAFLSIQNQIHILDLTNPLDPTTISVFTAPLNNNILRVSVNGNWVGLMFDKPTVTDPAYVLFLDISDLSNPQYVGLLDPIATPTFYDLLIDDVGDVVYLAEKLGGTYTVNLALLHDPEFVTESLYVPPRLDAWFNLPTINCGMAPLAVEPCIAIRVAKGENELFVTDNRGLVSFVINEYSYPENVNQVVFQEMDNVEDVEVYEDRAYVKDKSYGWIVLDVVDPIHPHYLGRCSEVDCSAMGQSLAADSSEGGKQISANGFTYKIEKNKLVVLGSKQTKAKGVKDWLKKGGKVKLEMVGSIDLPTGGFEVAIAGNLCYVAAGETGLQIFDITNPQQPLLLTTYDTYGTAKGIFIKGNHAYLADGTGGLLIIGGIK